MENLALKEIHALRTANVASVADLVHNVRNVAAVMYVSRASRYVAAGLDQRTMTDAASIEAVIARAEQLAAAPL